MTRPWSPAEAFDEADTVLRQLDEAVSELRDHAVDAAHLGHRLELEKSKLWLQAEGPNREVREAWVRIRLAELTEVDPRTGEILPLPLAADLAQRAYDDARQIITVLRKRADIIQSKIVTHRTSEVDR